MKKLLSIVLCAAAVSAFGDTTVSLGEVGVTKIVSKLTNTIVVVSYDDLAGGSGIVLSNFVKTANLTVGDQLAVFRGTGSYDTWVLEQNGEVKYWAKQEKTYFVGSDGKLTVGEGDSASGVTEAVGTGIWLVRKNPTDEKGDAIPFYIYGKPADGPVSTTVAGAWTLIGNPTQGTVTVAAEMFGDGELSSGDEIVVPVEPGGILFRYTYSARYGWRTTDENGRWVVVSPPLGAGLGCWIRTQKAASITWGSK